jgi:hypothetical protein
MFDGKTHPGDRVVKDCQKKNGDNFPLAVSLAKNTTVWFWGHPHLLVAIRDSRSGWCGVKKGTKTISVSVIHPEAVKLT